jgi:hypothetical protein
MAARLEDKRRFQSAGKWVLSAFVGAVIAGVVQYKIHDAENRKPKISVQIKRSCQLLKLGTEISPGKLTISYGPKQISGLSTTEIDIYNTTENNIGSLPFVVSVKPPEHDDSSPAGLKILSVQTQPETTDPAFSKHSLIFSTLLSVPPSVAVWPAAPGKALPINVDDFSGTGTMKYDFSLTPLHPSKNGKPSFSMTFLRGSEKALEASVENSSLEVNFEQPQVLDDCKP